MRIPPQKIADHLTPMSPVCVLTSDFNCFNPAMPYTHALALAARGEVEAVASKSGKVKYLRLLTDQEKPRLVVEEIPAEEFIPKRRASVNAQTEMGVYRQQVVSFKPVDEFGNGGQQIIGYVYAFCALRRAGM